MTVQINRGLKIKDEILTEKNLKSSHVSDLSNKLAFHRLK